MLTNISQITNIDWANNTFLPLSGGTLTGVLVADGGIDMNGQKRIYWKESGYGDKFAITPYFSGADDANLLKIQSAVGAAGTDPALSDSVTISGKSGNVWIKGGLNVGSTAKFQAQVINVVNGQRGTTPSANQYRTYEFQDTNGKRLAQVESGLLTDGTSALHLYVLGHYTSADSYSGIRVVKTKDNTGTANLIYNANTGQLSGINKLTFRTQLYYNASGTNGNITLSQSAANFNNIEVFFRTNSSQYNSSRIYSPNGKEINLTANASLTNASLGGYNILGKSYTISGTAFNSKNYYQVNVDGAGVGQYANNNIYVYRIVGWNE